MTGTLGLCVCFSLLMLVPCARGAPRERVYYVGVIEDLWDYAPSGRNLINGKDIADDENASIFLARGPDRIGRVYKKAMYRQYTNASYTQQSPRPDWLGYLGPVFIAEVDEVIVVHFKNMASRNYSIHPHGVRYKKDTEGALYPDKTSGNMKMDDAVPPGGNFTYRWEVRHDFGPTQDDPNCLTWVYHSHVESPKDIAAGLIGALLTCKPGVLKEQVDTQSLGFARNDVDLSFILMFTVLDENRSWYITENINTFCSEPDTVDVYDDDFKESNLMHVINGYVFGNLPDMLLCQHRPVSWHLFGMGNEVDVHSAYFHGNTLLDRGHRGDVVSLFPGTFVAAQMDPISLGRWPLNCQTNDHLVAGMQAFYKVEACGDVGSSAPTGVVRDYYVAAEEVTWDYGPSGFDKIHMTNLTSTQSPSEVYFGRTGGRLGGEYLKAVFRGYTDSSFTRRKPSAKQMGILGPVLRGEVGDTIRVTFRNKASRNYSIQPHMLHIDKPGSGDGDTPGAEVGPGETFVYAWQVLEGPSPLDPACIPFLYYSGIDPPKDTNSGLVGPLLVCKQGSLGSIGVLNDVDKEFFLLYSVMDENESWYIDYNTKKYATPQSPVTLQEEAITESNKMHAVNGLMYGNLGGLDVCLGEHVVWYILGLGTEMDVHGAHFDGNTFQRQGTTRDSVSVFPHTSATLTMRPQTLGKHEVNCRVTDHYRAGMRNYYHVSQCWGRNVTQNAASQNAAPQNVATVATYYISAEETEWDYYPNNTWEKMYHPVNSASGLYVLPRPRRIGAHYKKAIYREYTDETFTTLREGPLHLGIMGPLIKAEVGDKILIVFKNKASRPYSIHAQGIESSQYTGLNPVQPGFISTNVWNFPVSLGPGPSDPNCLTYAYFSPVDFIKDMHTGLLGPLVICRRGALEGSGRERKRRDVQNEFALLFLVFDENQSWYLDENVLTYLNLTADRELKEDHDFAGTNRKYAINGLVYGNVLGLEMSQGQRVDWYLLGMGNDVDIHTVHFHAETFTYRTDGVHSADVFDLFPGIFQTVEMVMDNPGTWLLHCHVSEHLQAGMEAIFTIKALPPNSNDEIRPANSAAVPTRASMATVVVFSLGLLLTHWKQTRTSNP